MNQFLLKKKDKTLEKGKGHEIKVRKKKRQSGRQASRTSAEDWQLTLITKEIKGRGNQMERQH